MVSRQLHSSANISAYIPLLMWIVLVETEKNPGWLWKERLNRKCLALPQSLSLGEHPDINIDKTENFNSIYNIELNSGLRLDLDLQQSLLI